MGISTSTEALIAFQEKKIAKDKEQKQQVAETEKGYSFDLGESYGTFKFEANSEVLSWYEEPIEKLDKRIYEINVQIVNLQNQILAIGQSANTCGCGGKVGFGSTGVGFFLGINTITVYADTVTYRGWTYEYPTPFVQTSGNLTASNSGVGTENLTGQVSIGVYYGNIGIARTNIDLFPICPGVTTCSPYPPQITALQNQISPLQSERNDLISKVNFLKSERAIYKIREYGYNSQKILLNQQINQSEGLINFLKDPSNEEWL